MKSLQRGAFVLAFFIGTGVVFANWADREYLITMGSNDDFHTDDIKWGIGEFGNSSMVPLTSVLKDPDDDSDVGTSATVQINDKATATATGNQKAGAAERWYTGEFQRTVNVKLLNTDINKSYRCTAIEAIFFEWQYNIEVDSGQPTDHLLGEVKHEGTVVWFNGSPFSPSPATSGEVSNTTKSEQGDSDSTVGETYNEVKPGSVAPVTFVLGPRVIRAKSWVRLEVEVVGTGTYFSDAVKTRVLTEAYIDVVELP